MNQLSLFEEDNARPAPAYFEQWPDGPRGDNLPFTQGGVLYAWECRDDRDGYNHDWFPSLTHIASHFQRRLAAFPVLAPEDALLGTQYNQSWNPVLLVWNAHEDLWHTSSLSCAVQSGFIGQAVTA